MIEKELEKYYYISRLIFEDGKNNMVRGDETFDEYWGRKWEMIVDKMHDACARPPDPEYVKWIKRIGEIINNEQKEREKKQKTDE